MPRNDFVISYDEKTSIQASRVRPVTAPSAGRYGRVEYEYKEEDLWLGS